MPLLDLPENKPGLNFDKYGDAITKFICDAKPPQLTIGIFGQYGTGKSTLLTTIQNSLLTPRNQEDDIPTVVVNFQAWRHDNEDDLIIPFLLSVREHLKNECVDRSILDDIYLACRALSYSAEFKFGPIKFSADKAIKREAELSLEEVDKYTSAYSDILAFLKRITQDEKGNVIRRIVVFIDDLDRCFPSKALRLLEGVKSFVDIKGFVFVLALDPRVIKLFLDEKYGKELSISGKEYIEKMFQVSFMLPKPSKEMLNDEIKSITASFSNEITDLLYESLNIEELNLRQIKRILNFQEIISNIAAKELPRNLLFALQLVEVHWPHVFYFLKKFKIEFLDKAALSKGDYRLSEENNSFKFDLDISESINYSMNTSFKLFHKKILLELCCEIINNQGKDVVIQSIMIIDTLGYEHYK